MTFLNKIEQAQKLIKESLNKYDKIVLANSFGKDSMVIFHLCWKIKPDIKVFSIMTPFKFVATFEYKEKMEKRYNMNIETFMNSSGPKELWKSDPDKCCEIYKVEPTKEALKDVDAWITGLRRTEGRTRTNFDFIEKKGKLVKINPILDFEELDVWRYLAINHIPVNPMYKLGYRSLGCQPCSNPEEDESDLERSGRWKGTKKQGLECGIHSCRLK